MAVVGGACTRTVGWSGTPDGGAGTLSTDRQLLVVDLGSMRYAEALEIQRDVASRRISGEIEQDVLLLVEHPHVITLGRSTGQESLLDSPDRLASLGVELFEVERGGDATYHGPGQIVGYPVVDLKRHRQDLHWFLRQIEEALIGTLGSFGILGLRRVGYTGVWIGEDRWGKVNRSEVKPELPGAAFLEGKVSPFDSRPWPCKLRKIASIGVHAKDWVTWHGFALNVSTNLRYFDSIVPCGIADVRMTSMQAELGPGTPDASDVANSLSCRVAEVFSLAVVATLPSSIRIAVPG